MTRNIKGMITMKNAKLFAIAGTCLALALAGCASTSGGTKSAKEPLPDEEGGRGRHRARDDQQGGRRADHPEGEEAQHQRR